MCLCVLLQFDVLAGIAVAFTIVPQSISYAAITGVPAHMGLYGAFLPVIMYAGGKTCTAPPHCSRLQKGCSRASRVHTEQQQQQQQQQQQT